MAEGDRHIIGIVQQHDSITYGDMLASFQGRRLDGAEVILWDGRLYLFAHEPSPLWEAIIKKPEKP